MKLNAEIYGTRAKAKLRLALQLAGLLAVALGAFNLLAVPVTNLAAIAPYRTGAIMIAGESGVFYLSDIVVMVIGSIVVWWS